MVDITEEERKCINRYQYETYYHMGMAQPEESIVQNTGLQLLDGHQAVAYARIRELGNGDFERTSRQRIVMEAILHKV